MSSGPVGLDVREYTYGCFQLELALPGFYQISAGNNWLVTKVQLYASTNASQLVLTQGNIIPVAASGCAILEPNGAHKDPVSASGVGAVLIIEYWFQSLPGFAQLVINTVPP